MTEAVQMAARFCLAELLDERGISQSELARRSKVSLVTINSIANNRTAQVKLDTLEKLARALGVEPGELIASDRKRKGK